MQFCFFRRCIYNWFDKALEKWLKMRLWRLLHNQEIIRILFFLFLYFLFFQCFLVFSLLQLFFHLIGTWESPGTIHFGACLSLAASYFVTLRISSLLEQTLGTQHMMWTSLSFYYSVVEPLSFLETLKLSWAYTHVCYTWTTASKSGLKIKILVWGRLGWRGSSTCSWLLLLRLVYDAASVML